ncbi:MAG: SGNH/GDSL hydrolase family protein [Oscillospiraceae bacterium]
METLVEVLGESVYEQALTQSVLNLGCGQRLGRLVDSGKIKIAFLGASITYGYHASPDGMGKAFPEFLKELLEQKTGAQVEIRNMAVSGTNSLTGMLVTQMLIPEFKPDIVVLDYSINEESHPIGLEKFESLIRMLLLMEWKPVVIPIAVFNRDGYSCQEYMLHFSKHYGLPMVGLYRSVYPLITSGVLPMNVYTEDEGHPHVDGHFFIAKCIMKTIEQSIAENAADMPPAPKITAARFEGLRLFDLNELTRDTCENTPCPDKLFGICRSKLRNNSRLIFETQCNCSQVVVMYIKNKDKDFAAAELLSDGKRVGGFNGHGLFGWNNPWTELIMSEEEQRLRTLRLETERGDENKKLHLVAAAYC